MIYKTGKVQQDVRVVLDKNNVSTLLTGVVDIDTLNVDEIIRSNIVKAVRNVHNAAPVFLLEQGHTMGGGLYWNGDGSGWLLLPDDFMRFVVFQMSDWSRPVYEPLTPDDAEYAWQHSRWKGVRGTPEKPVCAVAVRQEGKVLEFWSCKTEEAYVLNGVYIPYPHIDKGGGIDISERCYEAVVYECAALASTSLGDATTGALLRAEARTLLGLTASASSATAEQ